MSMRLMHPIYVRQFHDQLGLMQILKLNEWSRFKMLVLVMNVNVVDALEPSPIYLRQLYDQFN